MTFGVQAVMDANPGFTTIQGDIKNGYNEVTMESVLQSIQDTGTSDSTPAFSHTLMHQAAYVGMGSCKQLIEAPFKCAEGVHQGAVESGCCFAPAYNKVFQKYNTTLLENGGSVIAIIDNNMSWDTQSTLSVLTRHLVLSSSK